MIRKLLLRGLLAGFISGIITFGFATITGEPSVSRAIAFEQTAATARGEPPEPELVSRKTQAGLELLTAIIVYGTSVGGLFSLVFAYTHGRSGKLSPQALSGCLAAAAFVAIVIVPAIKYPANPPSVGEPGTIGYRTELYFTMLLVSVATKVFAVKLRSGFERRLGAWTASISGAVVYLSIVIAVALALPEINEVPSAFPAVLLWNFRMAALGMHVVLWGGIGILFGEMSARVLSGKSGSFRPHRPHA
jgi:Probable cobalt transporter subunit (CbtA)